MAEMLGLGGGLGQGEAGVVFFLLPWPIDYQGDIIPSYPFPTLWVITICRQNWNTVQDSLPALSSPTHCLLNNLV